MQAGARLPICSTPARAGSIMIDQTGVWMIDPEFAMYGPMGFDVGKFHANLLLMLFATHGHERTKPAQGQQYAQQRGGCVCGARAGV